MAFSLAARTSSGSLLRVNRVHETVLNCLAELESVMGSSGYSTANEIDRDALIKRTFTYRDQ